VDGKWMEYKNICYSDLQRLGPSLCPRCFDRVKEEMENKLEKGMVDIEW
jgi:hypothetical protein